ncbi:hypothetical protein WJX84_001747 [Apatococcus fuscideae]
MAPGVLCASAGAAEASASGLTHAVHFRFGSQKAATTFQASKAFKHAWTEAMQICNSTKRIQFQGHVGADLEDIFRRGPEWESGYELIMAMQEPQSFLESPERTASFEETLNQQCAQYALQAVTGTSFSVEDQAGRDLSIRSSDCSFRPRPSQPAHDAHLQPSATAQRIILMRFCQQEDLHMFRQNSAAQLMNNLGSPLVLSLAFAVQPAQKTQTRSR